ncbi:MAG TPA: hypothetical protein VHM20_04535 [Gammaproteobacteria bacterium]|jgi:hypothetical protein|nr:hypothetical protein [Gammaproteobacteria bacterium]
MFRTSVVDVKEQDINQRVEKFFTNVYTDLTLVVSACPQDEGGCISYGRNLAKHFGQDYTAVHPGSGGVRFYEVKYRPDLTKAYQNIVITGCKAAFSSIYAFERLKGVYNFSMLNNIYIVSPPHRLKEYLSSEIIKEDLRSLNTDKKSYNYEVILSGIDIDLSKEAKSLYIGLPLIVSNTEIEHSVDQNCFGLIYIRKLISSISPESDAKEYLENYFSQLKKIAASQSIKTPSVLIILSGYDTEEEKQSDQHLTRQIAETCKVAVIFEDHLPSHIYANLLYQLGKKGGIVGTNGPNTMLEASYYGCGIFVFSNVFGNDLLYQQFINSTKKELQPTAEVILGSSKKYQLLNKTKKTKEIYHLFHNSVVTNVQKFQKIKKNYTQQTETSETKELVSQTSSTSSKNKNPTPEREKSKYSAAYFSILKEIYPLFTLFLSPPPIPPQNSEVYRPKSSQS